MFAFTAKNIALLSENVNFHTKELRFYAKYSLFCETLEVLRRSFITPRKFYVISQKIRATLSKFYVNALTLVITIKSSYYHVIDTFIPRNRILRP